MSRNRFSILRAMQRLSKEAQPKPQVQEVTKKDSAVKKSITLALIAGVGMIIAYWNFAGLKINKLSPEEEIIFKEDQKRSVQQGLNLLKKKYNK